MTEATAAIDSLAICRPPVALPCLRAALARGRLTIGFLGGSITDSRPGHNWPETLVGWFNSTYPGVRLAVDNAAIGATGSELAAFRARTLLDQGCDLVFVEHAVNDNGLASDRRRRSREGVVRQLLGAGSCDVMPVYTFCQEMYEEMLAGRLPASIAEFEELASHYGLGSVWMGLAALREVLAGRLSWPAWLPDGLHPQHVGSACYGRAVADYLARCLAAPAGPVPPRSTLPPPLHPRHWQQARVLPWDEVRWQGPWSLRRVPKFPWVERLLCTAAPGARLAFDFEGASLVLGFDFGTNSGEFRYRLDGGEWQVAQRDRPYWVGPDGWFRLFAAADELPAGQHRCELETLHPGPAGKGCDCHLALIGVIP